MKFGTLKAKKIVQVCKRRSEFCHSLAKETRGRTADLCWLCFTCVHWAQRKRDKIIHVTRFSYLQELKPTCCWLSFWL